MRISDDEIKILWDKFDIENFNYELSNFEIALTNKNFFLNQIIDRAPEERKLAILEQQSIFEFLSLFHNLSDIDRPEKIAAFKNEVTKFVQNHERDNNYYQIKFNQTNNKFEKIRYGYYIWFLKKDFHVFEQTLGYTLDFLQFLINQNRELPDITNLLCFSYNIMLLYASENESVKELLKTSCSNIIERVKTMPKMYRYLIEAILILVKLEKNEELTNRMILLLHEKAKDLQSNLPEKFAVCEGLLSASLELVDNLSSVVEEKKKLKNSIHVMLGDLHKNVAIDKIKQSENLVASIFYKKAADEYKIADDNSKHKEMLKLSSENVIFGDPIEVEMEFPHIEIEGQTEDERIRNLIKLYFDSEKQISNVDYVKERVKKDLNEHPLISAVSHQNFTEIGPSSPTYTDPDEIMNAEVQNYIKMNILYFEAMVSNIVMGMESNSKLTTTGVLDFISSFGILDETSIFLIKKGITHHFQKDYAASMHILIPQIETVLRHVLEVRNMSAFKEKRQAIMVRELGGLLDIEEIKQIIGLNFHKYIQIKYTDANGINLRNRISHGLLTKDDFSHANSFSLIYTILILLTMSQSGNKS
jgi:uncharacterized protein DUF4209